MTGISSRTGYTRRQDWHFSPELSGVGLTGALQAGQTRMSSKSCGMGIVGSKVVNLHCSRADGGESTVRCSSLGAGGIHLVFRAIPTQPRFGRIPKVLTCDIGERRLGFAAGETVGYEGSEDGYRLWELVSA